MKALIIGFGLIGKERYKALINLGICTEKEIDVIDPNLGKDVDSTPTFKSNNFSYKDVNFIADSELKKSYEIMIISAPHIESKEMIFKYSDLSSLILMEKPMGLSTEDAMKIKKLESTNKKIHIGFNYRFFTAIQQLKEDLFNKKFGEIINISMEVGFGHQPNAEKSWRLDPSQIPQGAILDPGIHLFDLSRFLFGEIEISSAMSWGDFWGKGYQEDISILGQTKDGHKITFHISNVMWRSTFKVEVWGTDCYGIIDGRGRSYGDQKYTIGKRWNWDESITQRESEEIISTSNCEDSFENELRDVLISKKGIAARSLDGVNAMKLVELVHESTKI
tara:strand:+ start:5680 stop:6684 length:1005 start_codon:yes stop_codon:yes gene_type:complete